MQLRTLAFLAAAEASILPGAGTLADVIDAPKRNNKGTAALKMANVL